MPPTNRSVLASLNSTVPLTVRSLPLVERLMPPDIVSPRMVCEAMARSTELGVLKIATSSESGSSNVVWGSVARSPIGVVPSQSALPPIQVRFAAVATRRHSQREE